MPTDFFFLIFDTCFLRDGFHKNIELHNRNLLCPILFWLTTVPQVKISADCICVMEVHQ
jgi:hypothetical protein